MNFNGKFERKGIRDRLRGLREGFLVLVVSPPEKYEDTNIEILAMFCNDEKLSGLYITVNRPYSALVENLRSRGVNVDNLFFIDLITKTPGESPERTKNCLFISSPENLTDLGIAIDEAIHAAKNKQKFLFVESVSALLLYNTVGTVKKLEHFLAVRMRIGGLKGILISLHEGTEKEIIPFLAQFCDKVIKVE